MLLSTNIGSKYLRQSDKLLLVGTCVPVEYPEIYRKYAKNRVCLHVCLETFHMNMAETKLACILKIHQPSEILVLTVDGSPHCLQLHVLAEDMHRYFDIDGRIQHVVVEKGNSYLIDGVAVKTARHLHKIQRLLNEKKPS
jgi:hypothetical protein